MGLGVSGMYSIELRLSVVVDFGLSLQSLNFNISLNSGGEVRDSRNRDMIATGEQGSSSPANNRQAKITYTGRSLE